MYLAPISLFLLFSTFLKFIFSQFLQSGGATKKKILPTSNMTFDTKGANFENDIDSEKWL